MMKPLARKFFDLIPDQKKSVHILLCKHALQVWDDSSFNKTYRDSVVGIQHEVDLQLPSDALACLISGEDTLEVSNRYLEPIAAMHDQDLSFPLNIEYAFYAIFNCFQKYISREDIDDWIIVNQALSSEQDEGIWEDILREAIEAALS